VRRARVLAVHYLMKIFGIVDVGWFHEFVLVLRRR